MDLEFVTNVVQCVCQICRNNYHMKFFVIINFQMCMEVVFLVNVVILLLYEPAKLKSTTHQQSSFHVIKWMILHFGYKENFLNKLTQSIYNFFIL
jgi:hypothetical protein